jgi:hypothetical protein
LPKPEQGWLVQAFVTLPLLGLGLRLLGFRRLQALLSHGPVRQLRDASPDNMFTVAQARARLVQVAARHGFYRPTCLPQSLALWWLLRCHGIEANLHIGVKSINKGLEAHAWVEFQGQPLNDASDVHQHFSPFGRAIAP